MVILLAANHIQDKNKHRQAVFVEKKREKNRGSLWFTLSWLQESFNSSFHSVAVWSCVLPLDKHLVFNKLLLWGHCSWASTPSNPALVPAAWFDVRPAPALVGLQSPAIICMLYGEGANKSTTAPISVPSVSEASALAFHRVIYAKLLPKMSFLSPTAPSDSQRVWHLSVFINFKDAFACFVIHSVGFSTPPPVFPFFMPQILCSVIPFVFLSQVPTLLVSLVPPVCIHSLSLLWWRCSTSESVRETTSPKCHSAAHLTLVNWEYIHYSGVSPPSFAYSSPRG